MPFGRGPSAVTDVLTPQEFDQLSHLFYTRTGIRFDQNKRYFVDRRVMERMQVTGSDTFRRYYDLLRRDLKGQEFQLLINSLTVHETYFFREAYQFDCMVQSILPAIVREADRRRIRIWVIPCSTGEEAYSVAIYLLEEWPGLNDWDVEIVASDIDTEVLDLARAGLYYPRSLQNVPDYLRRRYFTEKDGQF